MKPILKKFYYWTAVTVTVLACGAMMAAAAGYLYLAPQLPSAETYKNVRLEAPLRIFTAEGRLIAEIGNRRNPLTYDQIPDAIRNAVIANEDPGFYFHSGVDIKGLLRGFYGFITGANLGGGSTITMQLAKNISFTDDNIYLRTFKKIPFALQIQRELTKEEILTLYLNLVHFGIGSDGIGAAAGLYYGKPASELSVAESAMMASLLPNPVNYNPINNPSLALSRRNSVLQKMYEQNLISEGELQAALMTPDTARRHYLSVEIPAAYVAEMVRQQLYEQYGEDTYTRGFEVVTSIDGDKQLAANAALINGLEEYYDRPHGYRASDINYPPDDRDPIGTWLEQLQSAPEYGNQLPGIVTAVQERSIEVILKDGVIIDISWEGLRWARPFISQNNAWPPPESAADVARIGDLVRVKRQGSDWALGQVPDIQAALVSVGTNTGEILALVGGYDFRLNQVNRAVTPRPPGSNFKPFVYAAALENGYTPASTINDAPLTRGNYRPNNFDDAFLGPVTLRYALKDSRNVPAVRLYDQLTSDVVLPFAARFGFKTENFPSDDLTVALGSQDVSPLEMAIAYSVFANGGYKVEPWLIREIKNLSDGVIFHANPIRVCDQCQLTSEEWEIPGPAAPRVLDARVAYIMNSMLRSVIEEGSGRRVQRELGRKDLMGKTGTTNGPQELWFSGFNREIATSVFVGFDQPKPLGESEQGATVAVPIWIDYMRAALAGTAERMMLRPDGLVDRLIDINTGKPAKPGESNTMFEFFRSEDAPALPEGQNPDRNNETDAEEPVSLETLF
ncbi:MAG: PBP1A family penicillin-binding protein [Pseudohongiellaceae bacterium]